MSPVHLRTGRSDAGPAVAAGSAPSFVARRRALALATAAACALGFAVVGVLAFEVEAGHARDAAMLRGFTGLYGSTIDSEIRIAARLVDPVPYAVMGMLCIAIALSRRRTRTAVAVAIVLVGTGLTAQIFKHALDEPRYADWIVGDSMQNGWPSGHATAAMTLALCAVIVAPPAWRVVTALLVCGCTVTVAYATLALTWHYPSDVLAGFAVAGLWASAALAVLARRDADRKAVPPPLLGLLAAVGGGGALVAAALVGVASARVGLDAVDGATAVVGALAVATLALTLLVLVAIAAPEADE
jgi:membrane-associated phospholipid phosphatase